MDIFKIPRNDTEIHYEYLKSVAETSETVVLLHGNGLNSASWYKITDGLRERFNVLMYDFPGEGQSPPKATLPSWHELAEDLKLLLDHLQIEHGHLIGHGAGGNLAVFFTNEYAARVKTVCLISAPCYFSKSLYKQYIAYRKNLVAEGGFHHLIAYMVPRITKSEPGSDDWTLLWDSYNKTSPDMHFHFYELVVETNWIDRVKTIDKPVLLLSGALDPILTAYSTAITSSFIARSHYSNIPHASNMVFIDNPEETLRTFLDFVQRAADDVDFDPFLTEYHRLIKQELSQVLLADHDGALPRLAIEVLDTFSVAVNGKRIDEGWNRRFAKNLLLYLAVNGKTAREKVMETFWPDLEIGKARNQLRVSLANLRKIFADHGVDNLILSDREYIALHAKIECDLLDLLQALKNDADQKTSLDNYIDPVLHENVLSGFYDDWSTSIKQFIANMFELHYPELFADDQMETNRPLSQ